MLHLILTIKGFKGRKWRRTPNQEATIAIYIATPIARHGSLGRFNVSELTTVMNGQNGTCLNEATIHSAHAEHLALQVGDEIDEGGREARLAGEELDRTGGQACEEGRSQTNGVSEELNRTKSSHRNEDGDGNPGRPAQMNALPFRVKLTGYRLLGLAILLAALSKFVLTLSSSLQSTVVNSLDLALGGVAAIVLWCLSWYEAADPPVWHRFFHVDYSRQVIAIGWFIITELIILTVILETISLLYVFSFHKITSCWKASLSPQATAWLFGSVTLIASLLPQLGHSIFLRTFGSQTSPFYIATTHILRRTMSHCSNPSIYPLFFCLLSFYYYFVIFHRCNQPGA